VKPPAFDYLRAELLEEALAALAEHGDDAKVIAGGQSLMAMLNMRLLAPEVLVDINAIPGLGGIDADVEHVHIGAGVTQGALARWNGIEQALPMVARALRHVGHYQTRARGTVCGSLAHADPSSELPLCLATLGGEVILRSAGGTRSMGPEAFQVGMLETACGADEIVESVSLRRRRDGEGQAFAELARRHGDFAIAAAAATASGEQVRLGIGGIADSPQVMQWESLAANEVDAALDAMLDGIDIMEDRSAPAAYRARLARHLGRRVIEEARRCRC